MLINKNGVKGKEDIHNTIKKNHQGSPWEFTTVVNLWRLWYPKKLSKKNREILEKYIKKKSYWSGGSASL